MERNLITQNLLKRTKTADSGGMGTVWPCIHKVIAIILRTLVKNNIQSQKIINIQKDYTNVLVIYFVY